MDAVECRPATHAGSGLQRLLPVGAPRRANGDCLDAALGNSDRRWFVWRLYEVQRSQDFGGQPSAAPMTASP